MRWRARNNPKLIRRTWEGESVVFSPLSGETHFLNAFSDEALAALEEEALTLDGLVERLRELTPEDQGAKLAESLGALIQRFDDIGLIEPCPD